MTNQSAGLPSAPEPHCSPVDDAVDPAVLAAALAASPIAPVNKEHEEHTGPDVWVQFVGMDIAALADENVCFDERYASWHGTWRREYGHVVQSLHSLNCCVFWGRETGYYEILDARLSDEGASLLLEFWHDDEGPRPVPPAPLT